MYDFNSTRARKNPDAVISAFTSSFGPDDRSVSLVVKINSPNEAEVTSLRALTEGRVNIRILDRVMSRHEVNSLQAGSDCFVSLHRSEGFGLPIAEAMAQGKPVIATNWSGNVDFMNPSNAACVDYRLVRIETDQGPYKAGQTWAEPDVEQAAGWMKTLCADRDLGRRLGEKAKMDIQRQLDPAAVGEAIRRRLGYIRQTRPGPRSGR